MHALIYFFFRFLECFFSRFSYSTINKIGRMLGTCAFYVYRPFRKKALSNLAIAYGTKKSEAERTRIALLSFQNLMITCLEFFRLKKSKGKLSEIVTLTHNKITASLLEKKQGLIFLSAHQANWEIPFLAVTDRFEGVAIGRPIKNKKLYNWVLSIREMNGGKIVMPKNALKEGLKALRAGKFLGIVGDQAFPDSPYSYPLLGTRAWTTTTPALLAYKTKCPIVVGVTKRIEGRYIVTGSDPIWPDFSKPVKEEVPRLMDKVMGELEKSIEERPEEWMWVHDRWKQQSIDFVKRPYRYGFILVVLPNHHLLSSTVELLKRIYPRNFLTFAVPDCGSEVNKNSTYLIYKQESDLFIRDFRYQLVLDFYGSSKLRRHFRKLGAVKTVHFSTLDPHKIKQTLVKKECLITVSF